MKKILTKIFAASSAKDEAANKSDRHYESYGCEGLDLPRMSDHDDGRGGEWVDYTQNHAPVLPDAPDRGGPDGEHYLEEARRILARKEELVLA